MAILTKPVCPLAFLATMAISHGGGLHSGPLKLTELSKLGDRLLYRNGVLACLRHYLTRY